MTSLCTISPIFKNYGSFQKLSRLIRCYTIESQVNIFDMKAKALQKKRAASLSDSSIYDYLRNEMAERMVDRVYDIKRTFKEAVDYGCGKGYISKYLVDDTIHTLHQCDVSTEMLSLCPKVDSVTTRNVVLDGEVFPFPEKSLDMVISSLSLHWVNDLPGLFAQIKHSLKNDACFLGVIFGSDTLYELRVSLQLAEMERQGGVSPHVSPFTTNQDLGSLLNRAGFNLITIDVDEIVVHYPTMFQLMEDIKGMAENNCAFNRKLRINKDTLIAAAAIYKAMYGVPYDKNPDEIIIPATFSLLHFIAWKPDPSQPKPAQRGSGEVSLKDIPNLESVVDKYTKPDP